jgi:hypothetical protein
MESLTVLIISLTSALGVLALVFGSGVLAPQAARPSKHERLLPRGEGASVP